MPGFACAVGSREPYLRRSSATLMSVRAIWIARALVRFVFGRPAGSRAEVALDPDRPLGIEPGAEGAWAAAGVAAARAAATQTIATWRGRVRGAERVSVRTRRRSTAC